MSTISSKQEKRRGLMSPDLALVFVMLIGVLVIFGSSTDNTYSSYHNTLGIQDNAAGGLPTSDDVSFASDEQYWDANCSHGWSSNSMCDDIVLRAQLCVPSVTSAYCSDYNIYMQQFYQRKINNYQNI